MLVILRRRINCNRYLYLIYGIFNDVVCSADYIQSSGKMV
jgi:hypothetical protein